MCLLAAEIFSLISGFLNEKAWIWRDVIAVRRYLRHIFTAHVTSTYLLNLFVNLGLWIRHVRCRTGTLRRCELRLDIISTRRSCASTKKKNRESINIQLRTAYGRPKSWLGNLQPYQRMFDHQAKIMSLQVGIPFDLSELSHKFKTEKNVGGSHI